MATPTELYINAELPKRPYTAQYPLTAGHVPVATGVGLEITARQLDVTDVANAASETYVDDAINALVDGAPAALDTLNELAAAINDDANYAATVTTALGNRLRVDVNTQGLTNTEKQNGLDNLGITEVITDASVDTSGLITFTKNTGQTADTVQIPTALNDLTFNSNTGVLTLKHTNGVADSTITITSNEIADDVFRVKDNVDGTKKIAFEASGISTGATRTITMPDANVNLGPLLSSPVYTIANNTLSFTKADGTNSSVVIPSNLSEVKNASFSATVNRKYILRDGGSNITVTFPASPSDGDIIEIQVWDVLIFRTVVFDGNGKYLVGFGSPTYTPIASLIYHTFKFYFHSASNIWMLTTISEGGFADGSYFTIKSRSNYGSTVKFELPTATDSSRAITVPNTNVDLGQIPYIQLINQSITYDFGNVPSDAKYTKYVISASCIPTINLAAFTSRTRQIEVFNASNDVISLTLLVSGTIKYSSGDPLDFGNQLYLQPGTSIVIGMGKNSEYLVSASKGSVAIVKPAAGSIAPNVSYTKLVLIGADNNFTLDINSLSGLGFTVIAAKANCTITLTSGWSLYNLATNTLDYTLVLSKGEIAYIFPDRSYIKIAEKNQFYTSAFRLKESGSSFLGSPPYADNTVGFAFGYDWLFNQGVNRTITIPNKNIDLSNVGRVPGYTNPTAYVTGDVVAYNGQEFRCRTTHTSSTAEPDYTKFTPVSGTLHITNASATVTPPVNPEIKSVEISSSTSFTLNNTDITAYPVKIISTGNGINVYGAPTSLVKDGLNQDMFLGYAESATVTNGNRWATGQNEFADDVFRVKDNADGTKKIAFEASGISTGTTRTITMPNVNVNLGDIPTIANFNSNITSNNGTILSRNSTSSSANGVVLLSGDGLSASFNYSTPGAVVVQTGKGANTWTRPAVCETVLTDFVPGSLTSNALTIGGGGGTANQPYACAPAGSTFWTLGGGLDTAAVHTLTFCCSVTGGGGFDGIFSGQRRITVRRQNATDTYTIVNTQTIGTDDASAGITGITVTVTLNSDRLNIVISCTAAGGSSMLTSASLTSLITSLG